MNDEARPLVLIGDVQTRVAEPGDYRFLKEVWRRVREEVPEAGPIAHYVGLRTRRFGEHRPTFLAAEVADAAPLPEGMFAWVLDGERWRVLVGQGGGSKIFWETQANWLWRHQAPSEGSARSGLLGEFSAELPPSWRVGQVPPVAQLSLWHHAYSDLASDGPDDELELVEYRSTWGDDYAEMAAWLREHLADRCEHTIEHVGSTAIEGMLAKPIIDVVVETPDMNAAKAILCPLLSSPRWECWASDDDGTLSFVKRDQLGGRRTHHVHLQARGLGREPRALFRDYLRAHPAHAARYAALKRESLRELRERIGDRRTTGVDREHYTRAKSDFVRDILAKAARDI